MKRYEIKNTKGEIVATVEASGPTAAMVKYRRVNEVGFPNGAIFDGNFSVCVVMKKHKLAGYDGATGQVGTIEVPTKYRAGQYAVHKQDPLPKPRKGEVAKPYVVTHLPTGNLLTRYSRLELAVRAAQIFDVYAEKIGADCEFGVAPLPAVVEGLRDAWRRCQYFNLHEPAPGKYAKDGE